MRSSYALQLGSSPHSLQLEKSPWTNEDPAQAILNLLFFKEVFSFFKFFLMMKKDEGQREERKIYGYEH